MTWRDLDLHADPPTVTVAVTLVEPRKQAQVTDSHGTVADQGRVFVKSLHRQPTTRVEDSGRWPCRKPR